MLAAVLIVKLIAEIALLSLLGQGLVGLLAGAKKDTNLFYNILATIGRPFVRAARYVSPKFVLDRHVPLVAFMILFFVWVACVILKIQICLDIGVEQCK